MRQENTPSEWVVEAKPSGVHSFHRRFAAIRASSTRSLSHLSNLCKFLLLLMVTTVGHAANVNSSYNQNLGLLNLPHLIVGDAIYYARLNQTDAKTLSFSLDFSSLMNITRPEAAGDDINVDDTAIVGTWVLEGGSIDELYLKFNADGTYEHFENVASEACSPGTETGKYVWEPSTGLLGAITLTDENGECGISNTSPFQQLPLRIFIDDTAGTMQPVDPGDNYQAENFPFIKIME